MPQSEPSREPALRIFIPTRNTVAFWACTAAVAGAEGAIGWWLRHLPMDDARRELVGWLAVLLAFLAIRVAGSWGRDASQEKIALHSGDQIVRWVWSHPGLGLEHCAWLARTGRETAEIGSRARSVLFASATSLAVLLPLLVWLSPLLSSALVLLVPVLAWVSRRRWRASRSWLAHERELFEAHSNEEEWAWRAAPESLASGTWPRLARLRRSASSVLRRERLRGALGLVGGQAQTEAAAHLAGWLLAGLALLGWSRGLLPGPDLLAFLAAALLAYRPIREAGRSLPAYHRLSDLLASCVDSRSISSTTDSRLRFEGLRVSSAEGEILVDGPTLDAGPGDAILVSGDNGSGKSSILSGVARLKAAEGISSRPRRIRYLSQEPVLPPFSPREWSGSLDSNSLSLTHILFPEGLPCDWNAPIPKGGSQLSRGERARLALLCLTARPADLWILDEPFSALPRADHPTVLAALRREQGSTILLFAEPGAASQGKTTWSPLEGRPGPRIQSLC